MNHNTISNRLLPAAAWGFLLLVLSCLSAQAAEFAGAGIGSIPDNNAAGLNITFSVSGIVHPVNRIRLQLTMAHTFVGDLEATLTSPSGLAHLVIFGRVGASRTVGVGYSSDINGVYSFDDSGSDFWVASTITPVPPGVYRTSTAGTSLSSHGGCGTSLAGAFSGLSGVQVNGTWTLTIADRDAGDTGNVSSAILTVLDDSLFVDSFDRTHGNCKLAQFDFTGTGRSSYAVLRNTAAVRRVP